MKVTIIIASLTAAVLARPNVLQFNDFGTGSKNTENNNNNNNGGNSVDRSLIPDFGVERGVRMFGTNNDNDCIGAVPGVPIPCQCPPSKDEFAAKLEEFLKAGVTPAGAPVSFPTGDSKEDKIKRIDTALVTLQSLTGQPGVGCPASATTLLAQKAALQ